MKNIEICGIVTAYTSGKSTMKLPAAVAWKRRVNMSRLMDAKKIIDEALQEIGKQYADDEHSTEKDGQRTVKPEYLPEYLKAQAEIMEQETDVAVQTIRIEDVGDITLSDDDMNTLAFMIAE